SNRGCSFVPAYSTNDGVVLFDRRLSLVE
ncbi:MAG: hypothetical protein JWR36_1394, partial [Glaciihabitans sp.]|nr:hypothetical protein [Glaciihabitans sp.]